MVKRYFLFAGDDYYPVGGIYDLVGTYDSVEECMSRLTYPIIIFDDIEIDEYDWYHIYDSQENKIIKSK